MKKIKESKGITLVALVITIIVLLILAGVVLNMVLGDNGIFAKAQNAKKESNRANAVEEIKLAILEVQVDKASKGETATLDDLSEELKKKADEYEIDAFSSESASVTRKIGADIDLKTGAKYILIRNKTKYGVEVKVTDTFQVSTTGEEISTSGSSTPGENPPAVTEYTVTFNTNGGSSIEQQKVVSGGTATRPTTDPTKDDYTFEGWYSDSGCTTAYDFTTLINGNTTIYAKWTEVATGPMIIEKGQTTARAITTADYGKKVSYLNADGSGQMAGKTWRLFYVEDSGNLFGDGEGTIYLKADWSSNDFTGSTSYTAGTTLIRKLNPDWATARGNSESSWKNNEKAAARLCDTSVWEPTYKSTNTAYSGKINWVVGAPSAEMFMKSYSQKVSGASNYGAKYYANGTTAYGYKYTTNGSSYDYYTAEDTISPSQANGMYLKYKGQQNNKYCYEWLASPSYIGAGLVCCVYGNGARVHCGDCSYTYGVCPLVSLKSNFLLEEIP